MSTARARALLSITEDSVRSLGIADQDAAVSYEERRASHVADRITGAIFDNRAFAHVLRDVKYNENNGTILLIMYPIANDVIDDLVILVDSVDDVTRVTDNVIKDDLADEDYHVLKVYFTEEPDQADQSPDEGSYEIPQEEEEPSSPVVKNEYDKADQSPGPNFRM